MPEAIRPTSKRRLPGRPPYVVCALRRKYAELKGAGDEAAMAYVGQTLCLFSPGEDLAAIKGVRPHTPARGHWSRTALDMLRKAPAPISAPDLARAVMKVHGLDAKDRATFMSVLCSLHATLGRLEGNGLVRLGQRPKRWTVE